MIKIIYFIIKNLFNKFENVKKSDYFLNQNQVKYKRGFLKDDIFMKFNLRGCFYRKYRGEKENLYMFINIEVISDS